MFYDFGVCFLHLNVYLFAVSCVCHLFHKWVLFFFFSFLIHILANLNDLLSYCDFFFLAISSLFISLQRRLFNISFRVSLVLLYSFTFCFSEKFFLSPVILNGNLAV